MGRLQKWLSRQAYTGLHACNESPRREVFDMWRRCGLRHPKDNANDDRHPVAEQAAKQNRRFAGLCGHVDGDGVYHRTSDGQRRGDWIQTFSGRRVFPMDPRPEEIAIEDIAHSLAMQCRYAGHCQRFYSVAEHSVHVSTWLLDHYGREAALWGLLHDASEAYLVDVPRPVKPFLAGYKVAERAVMDAVCERFGLPCEMPDEVHEADNRILWDEKAQNLAPCEHRWDGTPDPLGIRLEFWSPATAEAMFKIRYSVLTIDDRIAARDAERSVA